MNLYLVYVLDIEILRQGSAYTVYTYSQYIQLD